MPEIPPKWDEYLRLQEQSLRRSTIDSYSWGLEEEMNLSLKSIATSAAYDPDSRQRTRATAARRERARESLRTIYHGDLEPELPDPIKQLEAIEALQIIRDSISSLDWELLFHLGQEYTQAEIAKKRAIAAGTLRGIVFRHRARFHHLRPAA